MVRENLREDKGGVYSPYVGGSFDREPHGLSEIIIIFQCAPENVEKLIAAVKEEIKKLQTEGVSDDNFNKIREIQRRERETNLEKNEFWRAAITSTYQRKGDLQLIFEYNKLIDALTKDDIKAAANTYIDLTKAIVVTVNPEKENTEK
jgi:zinc protease